MIAILICMRHYLIVLILISLITNVCVLSHFSHVRLFTTLWTVAHQATLSMGILQARIVEWVVMPFSRGSSQPRDWTHSTTWEAWTIKSYFNQICLCKLILGSVLSLQSILGDFVVKNPPANARDVGLIPGLWRSPGEGNGNSLQYSCLGNPIDAGAWQAIVHGVAKESDMTCD